jgi:hypothetical protein
MVEAVGIEPALLRVKSMDYVSMLAECCYLSKNLNSFVFYIWISGQYQPAVNSGDHSPIGVPL